MVSTLIIFKKKTATREQEENIFKILLPKSKTNIRQKPFTCSILKHWNRLITSDSNINVRFSISKNKFRIILEENTFSNCHNMIIFAVNFDVHYISIVSTSFHYQSVC